MEPNTESYFLRPEQLESSINLVKATVLCTVLEADWIDVCPQCDGPFLLEMEMIAPSRLSCWSRSIHFFVGKWLEYCWTTEDCILRGLLPVNCWKNEEGYPRLGSC